MKTISNFVYEGDGILDTWRILKGNPKYGDCDDYAVTTLYENEGKVFWPLLWGKYAMYLVILDDGVPHIVLRYKDLYIDNITQTWGPKPNYKFVKKISPFTALVKLILGRFK